jgi:iron(III) transport system substrate-binding protein
VKKQNLYYTTKHILYLISLMFLKIFLLLPSMVFSNEKVLNLYTARHYSSDKEIYRLFTKQTGIKIREVTSKDQALLERLKSEGSASPADVIILADAARLWRAENLGLFQNHNSVKIRQTVPIQFQVNKNWIGLTTRARIIVANKRRYPSNKIESYQDLARPEFKKQFCSRSSTHPYMLSLVASIIINTGEIKTKEWATKMVSNQARTPRV